jgi:hypothetical protein
MNKKILSFVMSSILGLSLFFTSQAALAVSASRDQYCTTTSSYDVISGASTPRTQTFKPKQNRLTQVNLIVGGTQMTGSSTIRMKILQGSTVLGTTEGMPTLGEAPEYRVWEFSPTITVTPDATYTIQVDVLDGSAGMLYWYHSNSDCYARGVAQSEMVDEVWDFNFETWGYTYTAPVSSNNVPASSTTTATSVPKTTISADIKAPTEPKATYDATAKAVNVSWKASTTADIEGYIVSRSEDNKTFTDLGTVKKDVLTYQDKSITQEKTYYYQIKAYKDTKSSAASSTTSVAIPKPGEEAVTANTDESGKVEIKSVSFWNLENSLLMSGGILIVLLAIALGVLIYLRKKKNLSFGKVLRFKKVK